MRSAWLALALVAASTTAASAGTYLGIGIGTAADMSGDSSKGVAMQGNDRSGRLVLGYRFGRLSLEAAGSRYGMFLDGAPFTSTQAAAALKYALPLGDGFELFARGGIQHTWLTTDVMGASNAEGTGWLVGGGVEYRFGVSFLAGGSIFADYERVGTTFTTDAMPNASSTSFNGGAGVFTVGVTLSL